MVSNSKSPQTRKSPEARRAEILDAAIDTAVSLGLEKITLRSVAAAVGVRPGLISHYYPAVEDLVAEAFAAGIVRLRGARPVALGSPTERLIAFLDEQAGPDSTELVSLRLDARHCSRHSAAMGMAIEEMEESDRRELVALISEGIEAGEFPAGDPLSAAIRILMAIDGHGVYVNSPLPFDHEAYGFFASDVAEWALGLAPGSLRADGRADLVRW